MDGCQFIRCVSHKNRGAIHTENIKVTIKNSIFSNNTMMACGAIDISNSSEININFTQINNNNAKRVGGMQLDGSKMADIVLVISSNITNNKASKWIGGARFIHSSASNINTMYFHNSAEKYGALFDFNGAPSECLTQRSSFVNNTGIENSAGLTAYRMLYHGQIENCQFYHNNNGDILILSDYAEITLTSCNFDKSKSDSLFFEYDNIKIIEIDNTFSQKLKSNST